MAIILYIRYVVEYAMHNFELIFDDVILAQLKEAGKDSQIRAILSKLMDKIEELGPRAGKLIDSKLHIYEAKMKHPPMRLYFKQVFNSNKIYVFEYEFKTSEKSQRQTIARLKNKVKEFFT